MVLSGVLGGVVSGVGGVLASNDGIGTWANYAANAGVNSATQAFERRFARINYTIQQQQLHREDIRDLVELTVGRMDVYLIVGTLLLTFCISWYTENSILESGLPTWFITLFLVSNFTAAAYLVFAVWLAMHAAVASHSIGVRLLTSSARLCIPNAALIESIQTSVMPSVDGILQLGRKWVNAISTPKSVPTSKNQSAGSKHPLMKHPTMERIVESGSSGSGICAAVDDRYDERLESEEEPGFTGMIDQEDHFKRFLSEQRRWLGYDAYARICMCFGMNQMLQSLSYYILGIVWQVSPVSAMTSFVAVKMLGSLLLQLDVTGLDGSGRARDQVALFCLYLMPPIIACFILWMPAVEEFHDSTSVLGIVVFPVFILHAGWLLYLSRELYRGKPDVPGKLQYSDADILPQRLRTVAYLNVLQPEQAHAVAQINRKEARCYVSTLHAACDHLSRLMDEAMADESSKKEFSNRSLGRPELAQAHSHLQRRVNEAREATARIGRLDSDAERDLRRAERMLDRFVVWDQAPEICAVLKAFKDREVQGWLSQEEKRTVEIATQDFLTKCRDLGLGVEAILETDTLLPRVEKEKRAVHIRSYNDLFSQPSSVYISMNNGEIHDEAPMASMRSTDTGRDSARKRHPNSRSSRAPVSFHSAFEVDLPNWSRSAEDARRNVDDDAEPPNSAGTADGNSVISSASANSYIPAKATPDDRLPGMLVQKLTLGTASLWVCCALVHASKGLLETFGSFSIEQTAQQAQATSLLRIRSSSLSPLATTWPLPAPLFDVRYLQCGSRNDYQASIASHSIFVGSEFSTYVGKRMPIGDVGAFAELQEVPGAAAAVFCFSGRCSALVPQSPGSPWLLQPIVKRAEQAERAKYRPALLHVPHDWRRVVAAEWLQDQPIQHLRQARLAAWDGDRVVVADLFEESGLENSWSVRPRFYVSPGNRHSMESIGKVKVQGKGLASQVTKYDDVRALQFNEGAQRLIVLRGSGVTDVWDLVSGRLVAHWPVGGIKQGSFTAMCFDGKEFILARQLQQGPQLEVVEPPVELQNLLLQSQSPGTTMVSTQTIAAHEDFEAQASIRSTDDMVELSGHIVIPT